MRQYLPLLLLLLAGDCLLAVEIRPKVVGPPITCRSCCDRPGCWKYEWAVYHPAELEMPVAGVELRDDWVGKRVRPCCGRDQYDIFHVDAPDRVRFATTFSRYRMAIDDPRIPPVLSGYWPDHLRPAWFARGRYFYFVPIAPPAPGERASWWISADGQNWDLLAGFELMADAQQRQAAGGPPTIPLPPLRPCGLLDFP